MWVAQRHDGRYWAGEYKWHGTTFVRDLHAAYGWGSRSACECAIRSTEWNTANFTVDTVLPVRVNYSDLIADKPAPKRNNFA